MNFQGKAVLVYLEEDNIQRAYFRVRPLMTQDGPVGPMEKDFPEEGCLRIVPDRNEQHTFKDRMRSLCGLCVVDLRFFQPDANKIRTNKNYSPMRGEINQFIVYSDAVRALPEDLIYQVVTENECAEAKTPLVFIRSGANIQGPFRRQDGQAAGETRQLPPDSAEIFSLQLDGQDLLFYWPHAAEEPRAEAPAEAESAPVQPAQPAQDAPAPAAPVSAYEQIQAMDVAVSENANKLHDDPAPSLTPPPAANPQQDRPLAGTRLYQAPQRPAAQRRAHNPLMEIVERERYAGRYEAPGATLPQTAELKNVDNPADTLKRVLQSLWQTPETQRQAIDVLLSQPGLRQSLSTALTHETNDLTLAAMQSQLQEMEAERLMTLMQLDDAKKNLKETRDDAVGKLMNAEQRMLDDLKAAQSAAQQGLDGLKKELEPLRTEAEEALQKLQGDLSASRRLILPALGQDANKTELIRCVSDAFIAAGFVLEEGDAEALLTAYALSEGDITFYADAEPDAVRAIRTFAAALGVAAEDRGPMAEAVILPGGDAPVFLMGYQNHVSPLLTCCLHEGAEDRRENYFTPSFPCIPVAADLNALPGALPAYAPVRKEAVCREMIAETPLSDDTKNVILSLRRAMPKSRPLPLDAVEQMCRFIACTQNTLKGGVAEAIDRAVCLYAAPYLVGTGKQMEAVRPLLSAMPRTLKALKS